MKGFSLLSIILALVIIAAIYVLATDFLVQSPQQRQAIKEAEQSVQKVQELRDRYYELNKQTQGQQND